LPTSEEINFIEAMGNNAIHENKLCTLVTDPDPSCIYYSCVKLENYHKILFHFEFKKEKVDQSILYYLK